MKVSNYLALVGVLSVATQVEAAPRKVIAENFTATWCTYCPDVANGLILLQNEFPDSYFAIQIHEGDSYATAWGNSRQAFYSVPGYPTVWTDGTAKIEGSYGSPSGNYNVLRSQYIARQAVPTDVTMEMCGSSIDNDTYSVSVTVGVEAGGTDNTMIIHCAQVIHNYPSNPNYNYACFMQADNAQRSISAGTSSTVDFTFNFDSASMARLDDVSFITWAQSTNTSGPSEVFQAEKHRFQEMDCQIDEFIVGAKGDFSTITEAINASGSGDSIRVMAGTYVENIDFGGRAITITSIDGPEVTIIDGGGSATVVRMYSEPTGATVLDGFTIRNGNSPIGGGVLTDGSPDIINCIIRNNSAQFGGGIYHLQNNTDGPRIMDTLFCNNVPNDIYGSWVDAGGNVFDDSCGGDCAADISGDGMVSVTDLLAVIDAWGGSNSDADINGDGTVDVSDLLEIVGNWGPC